MFLHSSASHIFFNLLATMMIGAQLEFNMGTKNFTILYLLSGFGGILFSALCDDSRAVGSSTAIYGLIGSYAAYLALNWTALSQNTQKRCSIIIFLLVAVLFMVIF